MTFQATLQAALALLAWIPLCLLLFTRFTRQRAVVIAFVAAGLFLPEAAAIVFKGLPDINKTSVTSYGVLLGVLLFDANRLTAFRLSWFDLPILVLCFSPLITNSLNGLGDYDSVLLAGMVSYAIPYFLGRLYLNNLAGLRKLALGILIGGLIYVPLCLYEIFAGPQLHEIVYGYQVADSEVRWGGYRPVVFMQTGLSVGMWMMAATLVVIWLWQSGTLKKLGNIPGIWLVILLGVTFSLVRSYAAYIYLLYSIFILLTIKQFRSVLPLILVLVTISFYLFAGVSGNITPENIVKIDNVITNVMGPERAGSLTFRLDSEQFLSKKAREKPIFGWGGAGQNRILAQNEQGDVVDAVITDSAWVIFFGQWGAVGLTAFFSLILLPVLSFIRRYPASYWLTPQVAPAAVLSVILAFFAVDCLLNAMLDPVYFLTSGAITGFVLQKSQKPQVTSARRQKLCPR